MNRVTLLVGFVVLLDLVVRNRFSRCVHLLLFEGREIAADVAEFNSASRLETRFGTCRVRIAILGFVVQCLDLLLRRFGFDLRFEFGNLQGNQLRFDAAAQSFVVLPRREGSDRFASRQEEAGLEHDHVILGQKFGSQHVEHLGFAHAATERLLENFPDFTAGQQFRRKLIEVLKDRLVADPHAQFLGTISQQRCAKDVFFAGRR